MFYLFLQGKSGGGLREKPDADDNSTADFVSEPRTEGNHTQICTPSAFQRQAQLMSSQPREATLLTQSEMTLITVCHEELNVG